MTLILSNDDVEKLLTMPECIAVMEEAYVELAEGRGVNRTRSDCITPTSRPDAVYGDAQAMTADANTTFLIQCARTLPAMNFAEHDSGRVYARLESGTLVSTDPGPLSNAMMDAEVRAALRAVSSAFASPMLDARTYPKPRVDVLHADRFRTLGRWGGDRRATP